MSQAPWTADLYFVTPNETRVLARAGQLPQLHLNKHFWLANIQPILPDIRAALGDVVILRCLHYHADHDARQIRAVYELEPRDDLEGEWIEPEHLAGLPPEVTDALETRISEPDAPFRSPWARPGWFAQAAAWMNAQLEGVEHVEQVKNWGISSVLRAVTGAGDYYLKVSTRRALFGDEPRVTQALSERFPEIIPRPLGVNLERGWMILPDIGTNLYDVRVEWPEWQRLIRVYAQAQRELAGEPEWLLSAGCLDRRQAVLEPQVRELLECDDVLSGLTPEETQKLRDLKPQLLCHVTSLNESGIPDSLVHGDWHPGNIAVLDGVFRFFDWTDACLSHPFFDVPVMLDDVVEMLGSDAREPLLTAYLNEWADFAPLEHLRAMLPSIQIAGYLHQAVSYQHIWQGLEPSARFEIDFGVPYWLRRILESPEIK